MGAPEEKLYYVEFKDGKIFLADSVTCGGPFDILYKASGDKLIVIVELSDVMKLHGVSEAEFYFVGSDIIFDCKYEKGKKYKRFSEK